ncbi:MAG: DNA repair protein RecO [Lachnospiraceae bacterium]|nr:DNA repair protein RecO [Lachnospiraceae bacterium]
MQNFMVVLGLVLKAEPIGEYDRRVVLLTREKGKITVFARGARRQNNRFLATTTPFCFGEFKLFAGQNSYSLSEANITNYFEGVRSDFELAFYGMYFLEMADYYARENADDKQLLKLLYQSLTALTHPSLDRKLVRVIYEMKSIMINGEFPGIPDRRDDLSGADRAVRHLWDMPADKVYSFQVSEAVLEELVQRTENVRKRVIDREFKSLEMLEALDADVKGEK